MGKTVLLDQMRRNAESKEIRTARIVPEGCSLPALPGQRVTLALLHLSRKVRSGVGIVTAAATGFLMSWQGAASSALVGKLLFFTEPAKAAPAQAGENASEVQQAMNRAQDIRVQFVEQYGTDDEKRAIETGAPVPRKGAAPLQPTDAWVSVYVRSYGGLAGYTTSIHAPTPDNKLKTLGKRTVFTFLNELINMVPYGSTAVGVAKALESLNDKSRTRDANERDNVARTLGQLTGTLVRKVLPEEDQHAYQAAVEKGDYAAQTAYLYKVENELWQRQEFPNPYVVFLCDARGGKGEAARDLLAPLFPGNSRFDTAVWAFHDQYTKWKVVTEAYQALFSQGAADIADPVKGRKFLARFESYATMSTDDLILNAFGKDALKASAAEKQRMRAVALAKYLGGTMLAATIIGTQKDQAPGSHAVAQVHLAPGLDVFITPNLVLPRHPSGFRMVSLPNADKALLPIFARK